MIGIIRCAPREETESSPFKYQFQVLQRCDLLVQTGKSSTLVNVLETLKVFRAEWHRNQQFLVPSDVSRSNFLCPDVLLEIVKYLSWPDAVNAFSIAILSLLRDTHTKGHLNDPSYRFLEMIQQHFDRSPIVSLRVTDDFRVPGNNFSLFRTLDQLASLTVVSKRQTYVPTRLLDYLPNVRFVSLSFDEALDWYYFREVIQHIRSDSTTRLELRCPGVRCVHSFDEDWMKYYIQNRTITSFVFDLGHHPVCSRTHSQQNDKCRFLESAVKFMQSMINVRRVRFITVRNQSETLLKVQLWQQVMSKCIHLDRVIIKMLDDRDYTQETANIERELRQTRKGSSFQIKTA